MPGISAEGMLAWQTEGVEACPGCWQSGKEQMKLETA